MRLLILRWCQMMSRFEKVVDENPDPDLNNLWLDLVEKDQRLRRPETWDEPDYASKYIERPAYHHDHIMEELFTSQAHDFLYKDLYPILICVRGPIQAAKVREIPNYKGHTLLWNEMIQSDATS